MTQSIVTLVTGANRGIGYNIVLGLAKYFSNPTNNGAFAFTYLVAGRNSERINSAVKDLQSTLSSEGVADADIQSVLLDVEDDSSIREAVRDVKQRFGHLDVLVNNVGIAKRTPEALEDSRKVYSDILNTNVTSVANTVVAFEPLLREGSRERGLVINISSSRGSITRLADPASPKTLSVPYSMSKVALNGLTLELSKQFEHVEFQIACPGHCKTGFNNFRGARDPREGGNVVTLLVERWIKERSDCGFWETVGDKFELNSVPW